MKRRHIWQRGIAVLACAVGPAAIAGAPASAKPGPTFTPKTGTYTGTAVAGADHHQATAKVVKNGSKYSLETNVTSIADCESPVSGPVTVPVVYKVEAPIKGETFSFKGTSPAIGSPEPRKVTVDLTGHFTGESAFTATVKSSLSVSGPGGESISCTIETGTLKLKAG